jgi:hypothetical protein
MAFGSPVFGRSFWLAARCAPGPMSLVSLRANGESSEGTHFDATTLFFGTGIRRLLPCETLSDIAVGHCGSYEGTFPLAAVGEPLVFLAEGARNTALAVLTPGLAPGSRCKALRERLRTRRPASRDP